MSQDNIKPYWFRLFTSKKVLKGDNYEILAKELNLSPKGLENKVRGKYSFKPHEIAIIKDRYNLTDEEADIIFFRKEI